MAGLAGAVESERKQRGWTQAELAEASGVSLATVGAIEREVRSRFSDSTITRLAETFNWDDRLVAELRRQTRVHAVANANAVANGNAVDKVFSVPAEPVIVIEGEVGRIGLERAANDDVMGHVTVGNDSGSWMVQFVVEHADDSTDPRHILPGDTVRMSCRWRPDR